MTFPHSGKAHGKDVADAAREFEEVQCIACRRHSIRPLSDGDPVRVCDQCERIQMYVWPTTEPTPQPVQDWRASRPRRTIVIPSTEELEAQAEAKRKALNKQRRLEAKERKLQALEGDPA